MEIWKDISKIEGMEEYIDYQISSYGRVKSLKRSREIILKPRNIHGYLAINLYANGKRKTFKIHRLVAFAFIFNDNPQEKTDINHKDENKTNNKVSNLEWCTKAYNNSYGTRTERTSKKVYCLELNRIFNSIREIERQLGLYHSNISNCCNHRENYKTCGGYHFEFINIIEL